MVGQRQTGTGSDKAEPVELRRFSDLHGQEVYFECQGCQHLSRFDFRHWAMLDGGRGGKTLYEVQRMAKCGRCGGQTVRLLLKCRGIKGSEAWSPRPPLGRI